MNKIAQALTQTRELFTVAFLVVLFLGTGIVNPSFLEPGNILLCLNGSVIYILLAIGVSFVITTGDIDVSGWSYSGINRCGLCNDDSGW